MNRITKTYTLLPNHVATIARVAKNNGNSSASAALRFIIEEYARLRLKAQKTVITDTRRSTDQE
jgi:hypothetical protein